jgi:hypothetical protein
MTYKIISTNGNQTQVSIQIDEVEYTNLIVCNEGELDDAVATFVDSIKNPRTFEIVQSVDLNALVQSQAVLIESLKARLDAANL